MIDVGSQTVLVSHYTSMASFYAIAGLKDPSQAGLRLTDVRSFRDSSEGKIMGLQAPLIPGILQSPTVSEMVGSWRLNVEGRAPNRPDLKLFDDFQSLKLFATCFTSAEDSAPHWHAYGADAGGVELRIKLECQPTKRENDLLLGLFEVWYLKTDETDVTDRALMQGRIAQNHSWIKFDNFGYWANSSESQFVAAALADVNKHRYDALTSMVANFRVKGSQFSWEKEKRLIACYSSLSNLKVVADLSPSGLPVWRLHVNPGDFNSFKIVKVIISPGVAVLNEDERERILTGFQELGRKSPLLADTVFEFSKIKYRLR
jgi:hypothetical protein